MLTSETGNLSSIAEIQIVRELTPEVICVHTHIHTINIS